MSDSAPYAHGEKACSRLRNHLDGLTIRPCGGELGYYENPSECGPPAEMRETTAEHRHQVIDRIPGALWGSVATARRCLR